MNIPKGYAIITKFSSSENCRVQVTLFGVLVGEKAFPPETNIDILTEYTVETILRVEQKLRALSLN